MTSIEPTSIAAGQLVSAPSGGVYAVPVVGGRARAARQFFDGMAPVSTDSIGVAAGKNAIRYGSVVAGAVVGAAVVAIVAL